MTQNIYDDPDFFSGYSRLNRSIHGLDGAPEWPALRALLPEMRGLRVLDLGCGYGWFCRWAAEHGAAHVSGVDVSEKMLERAGALNAHPAVVYRLGDLESIELADSSFELVYSSLAFHYIENLRRLMLAIRRALVPGGRLVFSIEHPIYMAPRNPAFDVDRDGRKIWPLDGYQNEGARVTNWLAEGVVKQHRTMGTLVNTLIDCGFRLRRLIEWGPTQEQLSAMPALEEEVERPMMAIVAVER